MIRFLFKQNQPKRFQFKPRYYDETNEYLRAREAAIRHELEGTAEHGGDVLRSRMSQSWRSSHRKMDTRKSNRNVLLIVAVLAAIAYFLLYR
ncbi:MAG: hypothetical protein R2813_13555 [Flavobacteriales bacterium]